MNVVERRLQVAAVPAVNNADAVGQSELGLGAEGRPWVHVKSAGGLWHASKAGGSHRGLRLFGIDFHHRRLHTKIEENVAEWLNSGFSRHRQIKPGIGVRISEDHHIVSTDLFFIVGAECGVFDVELKRYI